jgi:NodT family efflux transporter outer membrane factor (OMF) lipoprotein
MTLSDTRLARARALALPPLVLLLAQGGCIHSSQVKQRPMEPPGTYDAGGAAARQPGEVDERWWLMFGDSRLNKLVDRALSDNLDLVAARYRVQQARAALKLAGAGWYPRLDVKGQAGRSQIVLPFSAPGIDSTSTRNSFSLSLAASYEVDLWGKVRYGHQAAKQDLEATEEDLRAARISIAAQLVDAYFLAVELRSQIELLDQTIKNREANLDIARRRYAEGVVTALDVYQAQENLASSQARRVTFINTLRTTEHAIAVFVGRFPRRGITGTLDRLPQNVRALPPGLPAQLLLRRPDLRAAHARLYAADARVGQAFAGYFPTLSISATVGSSFDPFGLIWSVLGNLVAPLFQGFRVQAQVESNRALLQQQLAAYKATLLVACKEVEDALVTGQMLEKRVQFLKQRVVSAEGSLRLSIEQYVQGLVPYLTVLASEQLVYTARSELITANRNLVSARVSLAKALGGGWTTNKDKRIPNAG